MMESVAGGYLVIAYSKIYFSVTSDVSAIPIILGLLFRTAVKKSVIYLVEKLHRQRIIARG
jgi:hypothetical protein